MLSLWIVALDLCPRIVFGLPRVIADPEEIKALLLGTVVREVVLDSKAGEKHSDSKSWASSKFTQVEMGNPLFCLLEPISHLVDASLMPLSS